MRKFMWIVAALLVAGCIIGNVNVVRAQDVKEEKIADQKDGENGVEQKKDDATPAVPSDDVAKQKKAKEQTIRDRATAISEEIEQVQKEINALKADTTANLEGIENNIDALRKRIARVTGRNKKFAERLEGILERFSAVVDSCETNPRPAPTGGSPTDKDDGNDGENKGSGEQK
ncbi:hypothetical protein HY625_00395 [Candidatus Uhrbacteria bacterium]|nr:hypothetical protein [Candidatus Uhrbacteria bacterium]